MMSALGLSSCSEDNTKTEEFANWQAKNEQAFADTLSYARQHTASGEWNTYLQWSLDNQTPINGSTSLTYKDNDYIAVKVLQAGEGSGCPMYTDSVKVSYRGRLLPSASYLNDGYIFDYTFTGSYDKQLALTSTMSVKSVVDGFATALLHMHIGDYWRVFIPYTLGYGESDYSSANIPAYSMLRFDMVLVAYKRGDTWITE